MAEAAIRQIIISRMIPTEPRSISTAEIHGRLQRRGMSVTRRTVQRDLNDLSVIFDLQCSIDGRVHRWFKEKRSHSVWM